MQDNSVDWDLARRVAIRISERRPSSSSYHYATLAPDFERFTAQAEQLVAEETGLLVPNEQEIYRFDNHFNDKDSKIILFFTQFPSKEPPVVSTSSQIR